MDSGHYITLPLIEAHRVTRGRIEEGYSFWRFRLGKLRQWRRVIDCICFLKNRFESINRHGVCFSASLNYVIFSKAAYDFERPLVGCLEGLFYPVDADKNMRAGLQRLWEVDSSWVNLSFG